MNRATRVRIRAEECAAKSKRVYAALEFTNRRIDILEGKQRDSVQATGVGGVVAREPVVVGAAECSVMESPTVTIRNAAASPESRHVHATPRRTGARARARKTHCTDPPYTLDVASVVSTPDRTQASPRVDTRLAGWRSSPCRPATERRAFDPRRNEFLRPQVHHHEPRHIRRHRHHIRPSQPVAFSHSSPAHEWSAPGHPSSPPPPGSAATIAPPVAGGPAQPNRCASGRDAHAPADSHACLPGRHHPRWPALAPGQHRADKRPPRS